MSGHSKWSTIKRKKAKEDAKKGKVFSRLAKELSVTARSAGGDPDFNANLRLLIQNAKQANMPADKIQAAIDRGTGAADGANYEEMTYEGYGPGGIAVILELLSDNKNRTSAEIRSLFNKGGGNLGESGCVAWNFEKRGVISLKGVDSDEDAMVELALEVGGEDVVCEDGVVQMITAPEELASVSEAIREKGLVVEDASLNLIPKNLAKVEGETVKKAIRFLEELEDHEDVRNVYTNLDIPEEVTAE